MDRATVICLNEASKTYPRRVEPLRGLWQTLRGDRSASSLPADRFVALHPCTLGIRAGEVVGVVGKNGAGKSTLLQLVTGTLKPSAGEVRVEGRVGAILELGAGFNPEFTGLENIHLALATAGATRAEIQQQAPPIIGFSGLKDFIDQPLKTYSSGMQVRLAFAVATSFSPEVLVIDEALSVGDGEFARRSFDRILALRESGATILFCSHSLFHVEALCSRALWLEAGRIVMDSEPPRVLAAYQSFLDGAALALVLGSRESEPHDTQPRGPADGALRPSAGGAPFTAASPYPTQGFARLQDIRFVVEGSADTFIDEQGTPPSDGLGSTRLDERGVPLRPHNLNLNPAGGLPGRIYRPGASIPLWSCRNHLSVQVNFASDPRKPCPALAVTLNSIDGKIVGSAGSWEDGLVVERNPNGCGFIEACFPRLALLKGEYGVSVYLFCERGLHIYDRAEQLVWLKVRQDGLAQGIFSPARRWSTRVPRSGASSA
jgi:lipopolysaccharide transport system ATP-binding protein